MSCVLMGPWYPGYYCDIDVLGDALGAIRVVVPTLPAARANPKHLASPIPGAVLFIHLMLALRCSSHPSHQAVLLPPCTTAAPYPWFGARVALV